MFSFCSRGGVDNANTIIPGWQCKKFSHGIARGWSAGQSWDELLAEGVLQWLKEVADVRDGASQMQPPEMTTPSGDIGEPDLSCQFTDFTSLYQWTSA